MGVASRGKRQKRTNKDNRDSGDNNDFLFRDTDPGASRDEDWKQSSDFQHIGMCYGCMQLNIYVSIFLDVSILLDVSMFIFYLFVYLFICLFYLFIYRVGRS